MTPQQRQDQRFSVWIEAVTAREDRFTSTLLRLGVAPDEAIRISRTAPCRFRGQLSLSAAEEIKATLRDAGARVLVRVEPAISAVVETVELPPVREPVATPEPEPESYAVLELDDAPHTFTPGAAVIPAALGVVEPAVRAAPALIQTPPPPPTLAAGPLWTQKPPSTPPVLELDDGRRIAKATTLAPELMAKPKPPAVWTPPDTRLSRMVGLVALGLFALLGTHCAAHYIVDDRMHSFTQGNDERLEQALILAGRKKGGPANALDMVNVAQDIAKRVGVKLHVTGITEIRVEGVTDMAGCSRGKPERNPGLPAEVMLRFGLRNQGCSAPRWIVGFRGTVTARVLWVKTTRDTEQFALADDYVGIDGKRGGIWLDVSELVTAPTYMPGNGAPPPGRFPDTPGTAW